jgi:hypothetical protein
MSDSSNFNSFSTTKGSFGTKEFLESNSLVAKIAFLFLVMFAFIVLLRIGITVVAYFFQPNNSPHLIDGMVDATQMIVYPQDPSNNNAVTIYRSVNAADGIEFTWSVWVFINNLQYLEGQYRHIFYKGNANLNSNGLNFPNNSPGLYLAPNTNSLIVMMNTYNVINQEITIPDIPINKWVNVIIRCQNTTLDVYINGTITRSVQLNGVPKQNYGDVYVGMNGGFSGYVSNLWYYDYALGTVAIQNLVSKGPNTKMIGANGISDTLANYLSLRWFFKGSKDMFNP